MVRIIKAAAVIRVRVRRGVVRIRVRKAIVRAVVPIATEADGAGAIGIDEVSAVSSVPHLIV